jgi:hypothetical protein
MRPYCTKGREDDVFETMHIEMCKEKLGRILML